MKRFQYDYDYYNNLKYIVINNLNKRLMKLLFNKSYYNSNHNELLIVLTTFCSLKNIQILIFLIYRKLNNIEI